MINSDNEDTLNGGSPANMLIVEIENNPPDAENLVEIVEGEDGVALNGGKMPDHLLHAIENPDEEGEMSLFYDSDTKGADTATTSSDGTTANEHVSHINGGSPPDEVINAIDE